MRKTAYSDRERERRRERFVLVTCGCCRWQPQSLYVVGYREGFPEAVRELSVLQKQKSMGLGSFLPSINQMDAALEKLGKTRVENNQQPDNTSPSSNPITCTK